jgi:pyruvate/2-oxoglutarate/acetoin dehydrogenase E1 component/TPP-dependent pyruvate/acetoin dehydrogenase alpha subunit
LAEAKVLDHIKIPAREILDDYRITVLSRETSLIGRKEVFMGKAKFGIFGDGKEVPQLAMARVFQNGDHRSGYYRDQTFMFAIGELTVQQYFAQLFAHTDIEADPSSAGRLMNSHFATRMLDPEGNWLKQTALKNSSSDISPTGAQMSRLVGLAFASKLYRNNTELRGLKDFSINGNEVAFGTIGNAATSEGCFFEAVNTAGVLQVPMVLSIWDDGYGISVPNKFHTVKEDIGKAMQGFQRDGDSNGLEIFQVKGWDYMACVEVFEKATRLAREQHIPSLIHFTELTQPLGHSTSGSHERYKSSERLEWESKYDCNKKFREWILENHIGTEEELDRIEKEARQQAKAEKERAWAEYLESIKHDQIEAAKIITTVAQKSKYRREILNIKADLTKIHNPLKLDFFKAVKQTLILTRKEKIPQRQRLINWLSKINEDNQKFYSSHLYSESENSSLNIKVVKPVYSEESKIVDGREVLQAFFNKALERDKTVLAFGEDVGKIGDVNQAFAGLQKKHGDMRVMDTSIRETTIIGEGIGLAMRGLRPIAEIQYLDYLIFAIQTLSDDLATLHYRTKGGQKAPLIIRTRGHRLEGVWHSGSPMGMILNSLRGVNILVPRDMTRAAGFYNTMLQSDDPALIIEVLNGYRLKERIPDNLMDYTVPVGVPEILRRGSDITIVTYGAMCRIVMEAAEELEKIGISLEVIDVQTLIPFDIHHKIVESLKKTNRIVFADEDVPGGASAYMMQKVLEEQNGYHYLDSKPITLTSKEHRPAYGSDGDYFSKANAEDVFDYIYAMMNEADPDRFPEIYNKNYNIPQWNPEVIDN